MKERISRIFKEYILSRHELMKTGSRPLDLAFNNEVDSYFETPRNQEQLHFQLMSLSDSKELEECLSMLWSRDPILRSMITALSPLAEEFRKQGEEQSGELDSFIYVMY